MSEEGPVEIMESPINLTYNFSAGPAVLPAEVLQQAADEMLSWQGSGMSVMEMSHRGREFESILAQAFAEGGGGRLSGQEHFARPGSCGTCRQRHSIRSDQHRNSRWH